jgi:hypothetical protein
VVVVGVKMWATSEQTRAVRQKNDQEGSNRAKMTKVK